MTTHVLAQNDFSKKYWTRVPSGKVFLGSKTDRIQCLLGGVKGNHPICKELKDVNEFYISKFEVSITDYMVFLDGLNVKDKKLYSPKIEKLELYENQDSTSHWSFEYDKILQSRATENSEKYQYPIVGITYEAANAYCKWLEDRIKKAISKDIEIRLPTEKEWIRATLGDNYFNIYAWEGRSLINKKGWYQCNFMPFDEHWSEYDYKTQSFSKVSFSYHQDGYLSLAPIKSQYPTNIYGLYNILGNVSEMLLEKGLAKGGNWGSVGNDVNVSSVQRFDGASYYIGFRPVLIIK